MDHLIYTQQTISTRKSSEIIQSCQDYVYHCLGRTRCNTNSSCEQEINKDITRLLQKFSTNGKGKADYVKTQTLPISRRELGKEIRYHQDYFKCVWKVSSVSSTGKLKQ